MDLNTQKSLNVLLNLGAMANKGDAKVGAMANKDTANPYLAKEGAAADA